MIDLYFLRDQPLDSIPKENMKIEQNTASTKKLIEDIVTPKTIALNQNNILNNYMEYSTPDKRIFANAETLCSYHQF